MIDRMRRRASEGPETEEGVSERTQKVSEREEVV